jgi:hypothetical protein
VNDHLQAQASRTACELLGPLMDDLSTELRLSDDAEQAFCLALTRAYLAGVHDGSTEVAAQVIEQGVDVDMTLAILDPLRPD